MEMSFASESFFSEFESLRMEHAAIRLRAERAEAKNVYLENEILWLKEQIAELKRERFGKKSERWESPEQGCLFNEAEVESKKPSGDSDEGTEETEVAGHKRTRCHAQVHL